MRRPASWEVEYLRASTAGIAALPGNCTPSASVTHAIVDAVPMVIQLPLERAEQLSIAKNSSIVIFPARSSSLYFHTAVPEPRVFP